MVFEGPQLVRVTPDYAESLGDVQEKWIEPTVLDGNARLN